MSTTASADDFLLPIVDGQGEIAQILTFRLGGGVFGIDVRQVREVLDVTPITPVANAPATLIGMVEVRSEGVPVVELKRKLRITEAVMGQGSDRRIVVLEIGSGDALQVVAIIADEVLEVVEHDPATLDGPPRFGEAWDASFIRGIGRRQDEFLTLLNIEAIFGLTDRNPTF